ncbi:cupin domain-containing protein [Cerasicoccus arenae]|uniref:Cupin type-2 domain-containing protein n=1 Tax=Cerasicoccus arenae TaxID=424488 RepID=A0A8J3GFN7_9BACT|nr:cupin domain-containing protein [Cerasicoccus arenae]MBK1859790.1 cupin domain-containing protein [Cerasicoccus arenae]GHC13181.1 hypothetical protein GCM10007047_33120 [Cerasicoccus arenae]
METSRIVHRTSGGENNAQRLGPYALESLIDEADELAMTAYRVTIAPGSTTTIAHHRKAEEIYFVLTGQGTAILNGVEHALVAGDFLRLPPGVKHGFVTKDEPLVMLDIHSPGSRPNRDVYFEGEPPAGFSDNR